MDDESPTNDSRAVDGAAGAVTPGQQLDTATLSELLRRALDGPVGKLRIRQFPGGHSNLTYLLCYDDRELVLRRPPYGNLASAAHDMAREYAVLTALAPVYPLAPRPLLYCDDETIIGSPFYVMERVEGVVIRRKLPPGMLLSDEQARRLGLNLVAALARLHDIDHRSIGLGDFGRPDGYVARQVDNWIDRHRAAHTPDAPRWNDVISWLRANLPTDTERPAIVHGDWKTDNLVLDPADPTRIVAVLDWEMATIGDPAMDVGYALIFFDDAGDGQPLSLSAAMPPVFSGAVTREELLDHYQELAGRTVAGIDFYYAFNLFRLAGLLQQLYHRYYHGETADERYAGFPVMVEVLFGLTEQLIARCDR